MSGCLTTTAYYTATQDDFDKIDKSKPVAIVSPQNSGRKEQEFARILSNKLRKHGYKIDQNSNCGFGFAMKDDTYEGIGSYTTSNTTTTTTNISGNANSYASGYVGNTYGSVYGNTNISGKATTTTTTPQTNYYRYSNTYRKMVLDYGCLNSSNEPQIIWEGFSSAEISDYTAHTPKVIENLVALTGENYTGNLLIDDDEFNASEFIKNQKKKNWLYLDFGVGLDIYVSGTPKIPLGKYGYYEDIVGTDISLGIPINLRIGYLRKLKQDMGLGLNLLYTKNLISNPEIKKDGEYIYGKTYYSGDAEIISQQIGVEATLMYKDFLLGIGISKDSGSSISFPVKSGKITKDLNGVYLPIRLTIVDHIKGTNLSFYSELASILHLSGENYANSVYSGNIGVIYLMDLF